jgi:hypothetical protein
LAKSNFTSFFWALRDVNLEIPHGFALGSSARTDPVKTLYSESLPVAYDRLPALSTLTDGPLCSSRALDSIRNVLAKASSI